MLLSFIIKAKRGVASRIMLFILAGIMFVGLLPGGMFDPGEAYAADGPGSGVVDEEQAGQAEQAEPESPPPPEKEPNIFQKIGAFFLSLFSSGTASEYDFYFDPATGTILDYTGSDTEVEIPATIGGAQVKAIGANAFYNKGLTSVTLPDGLETIGAQAFQGNALTSVTIPASVTQIGSQAFFQNNISSLIFTPTSSLATMGSFAFRSNALTSVTLPASLKVLPEGAFMQNSGLSSVNLSALTSIGNNAFSGCNFDTVTLPAGLTSYGNNVFANNGRYVLVSGSTLAKTYSIPGQFGEIAGQIRTLTVKYQDALGNQLLADQAYTTNRSVQAASVADLIVDGNTVTISLPKIAGYSPLGGMNANVPISGPTTYTAVYVPEGSPPYFTGVVQVIEIEVGVAIDLRAGIRAFDGSGNELTSAIDVNPPFINTTYPASYIVRYTVRDADGRTATAQTEFKIGLDPMDSEIAGGWFYNDFVYSADGKTLIGLSPSGIDKFNGGNTALVLPGYCPRPTGAGAGINVPIETVGNDSSTVPTFRIYNFDAISFDRMSSLKTIVANAFFQARLTSLDLRNCSALESIRIQAFYNSELTSLDLSGCKALTTIGIETFHNAKLTSLDLGGLTSLKTISENAFTNSPLTSLNLSGCISLETIGTTSSGPNGGVFRNALLTELDLSGLTKLHTIEAYAFRNAQLTSLDLSGLSALKTIGEGAFYTSPLTTLNLSGCTSLTTLGDHGSSTSNAKVGAFYSALLRVIDLSPCTALTMIGDNTFRMSPVTNLNLSGCLALRDIGYFAFRSQRLATIDLSGLTSLRTIWYHAFYINSDDTRLIDLSGCSALRTIDSQAFYGGSTTATRELKLSGCSSLYDIGVSAFHQCGFTELDFSDCTSLQTIQGSAFYYSKLTSLDLSACTALQTIGASAFCQSELTSLNLQGLTRLTSIGQDAFQNSKLTSLDLSGLSSLRDIGNSAFQTAPLTSLNLTGCTALRNIGLSTTNTSIAIGAFSNARLTELDLSTCTSLIGIWNYAFTNCPFTELDLTANTSLTTIGPGAFSSLANNAKVYLPSSVVNLQFMPSDANGVPRGPFGKGDSYASPKTTWVYVDGPTTLSDIHNTTGGGSTRILINKAGGYWLDLRDEDGNRLSAGDLLVTLEAGQIGTTVTVTPPFIQGYTTPAAKTIVPEGGVIEVVPFVYVRDTTTWITGNGVTVQVYNPTNYRQRINNGTGTSANPEFQINVRIDFTQSGSTLPDGSQIIIPVSNVDIDLNTIRTGTITGGYFNGLTVNEATREIIITLNEMPSGGWIDVPIMFKYFQDGSVPYNSRANFFARVVNSSTNAIVATSDPTKPAISEAYFQRHNLRAYVNAWWDMASGNVQTQRPLEVDAETDVYLGWWLIGNGNISVRNFEEMIIVYELPKYVNNAGETVYAQFIPENNPEWKVFKVADGTEPGVPAGTPTMVILDWRYIASVNTSSYTAMGGFAEVGLSVRFPDAKGNQEINTHLHMLVCPVNISAAEQLNYDASYAKLMAYLDPFAGQTYGTGSATTPPPADLFYYHGSSHFYLVDKKKPPAGDVIRVDKEANPQARDTSGRTYLDNHGEFFDNTDNTGRTYGWNIRLNVGPKYIAHNGVLHDYGLDPRMYYYGFSNLASAGIVEIVAYDSSGNELSREIPAANTYIFPSSIQYQIKSVDIFFLEPFEGSRTIQMLTKLYEEDMTVVKASGYVNDNPVVPTHINGVDFYNYVRGEFDSENKETGITSHATHDDPANWTYSYWKILHNEETMQAVKSASTPRIQFPGDPLTYTIGVNGYKMETSKWNGFALLDILPDSLDLINVRMSDDFASLPGAKYEIILNYEGTGNTAVLFTADYFNSKLYREDGEYRFTVGYIDVINGVLHQAVNFTNDVYAKVNPSYGVILRNPATAPGSFGTASKAIAQNGYAMIQQLSITKYIRNITGPDTAWRRTGVITEPSEEFEYKIVVDNATTDPAANGVVYDIFPYVGDKFIDQGPLGTMPRNSAFANTFVSVVNVEPGWTVYYTTAAPDNSRNFYDNPANWSTTPPSNPATVTGLMFVAGSGMMIPANGYVSFDIRMKAPSDTSLAGTRAINSAAHKEGTLIRQLEGNSVYNEIRQRGDIQLRKVEMVGSAAVPIEGVIFQIRDASGRIVQTRATDSNGYVTFDRLLIGDYTVSELNTPPGFIPKTVVFSVSGNNMVVNGTYSLGNVINERIPPEPLKASVRLTKTGLGGTLLPNVRFTVTGLDVGINDDVVVTKNTNTLGQVTFDDLPLGNYKIEEVWSSSLGYIEAKYSSTFNLTTNGQLLNLGTVVNDTGALTMVKIALFNTAYMALPNADLQANMGARLEGIRFDLYDGANFVQSYTTDATGQINFTGLTLNKTYTLREVLTPAQADLYAMRGTGAGGGDYTFMIDSAGKLRFGGLPYDKQNLVIGNNVKNPEYTALLRKVDQDGNPMPGVEFKIEDNGPQLLNITFSSNSGTAADGCLYFYDRFDNLIVTYTGANILATETVTIPGNAFKIRLTTAVANTNNRFTITSITDDKGAPVPGPAYPAQTSAPSPGANRDITYTWGYASSATPYSRTTGASGEILLTQSELETHFGTGAYGRYVVTEVKAPAGYAKSFGPDSRWEIDWNHPAGYEETTFVNKKTELDLFKYESVARTVYEVFQYLNLTHLLSSYSAGTTLGEVSAEHRAIVEAAVAAMDGYKLVKNRNETQWELRAPLEGAEFKVYERADPNVAVDTNSQTPLFTAFTDTYGRLQVPGSFKIDEEKTYEVHESKVPDGYLPPVTPMFTFKAAEYKLVNPMFDGTLYFEVENRPQRGSITLTKLDKYDGTIMPDIGFELYKVTGPGAENKVDEAYTDVTGTIVFSDLPLGNYKLVEILPPPIGYEPYEDEISLTLASHTAHRYVTVYNEPTEKRSTLEITKVDEDGELLPGMKFNLLVLVPGVGGAEDTWQNYGRADGDPYRATNSNGLLRFEYLPAGTYKIVEIPGDSPDWPYDEPIYDPSDTFTVTSDVEQTISVKVTNPLPDTQLEVELTKTADPVSFRANGDEIDYTLSFPMPDAAALTKYDAVKIVDRLPSGLVYKEGSAELSIGGAAPESVDLTVSVDGKTLAYELTDTAFKDAAGETVVLTLVCVVDGWTSGTLTNIAELYFRPNDKDYPDEPDADDPETITPFTKEGVESYYEAGKTLDYIISFPLRDDLADVDVIEIIDTYPVGKLSNPAVIQVTFGTATLSAVVNNEYTVHDDGNGTFTIRIEKANGGRYGFADLGGQDARIVLRFDVDPDATGTIVNKARVEYDGEPGGDDDETTDPLKFSKSADLDAYEKGDVIEYTLTFTLPSNINKFNESIVITDRYDSRKVSYIEGEDVLVIGGKTLVRGTDYTILNNQGLLEVSITEVGIGKLGTMEDGALTLKFLVL